MEAARRARTRKRGIQTSGLLPGLSRLPTRQRDKSIAGLDRLPNFRADTIRSWILAKMVLTQIARKIATPHVAIPPCAT
jgi:hypothetical protein